MHLALGVASEVWPLKHGQGALLNSSRVSGEPVQGRSCWAILHSVLLSVEDDLSGIDTLLSHVGTTLDGATSTLCDDRATGSAEAKTAFQTNPLTRVTSQSQPLPSASGCPENTRGASESHDTPGFESARARLSVIFPEEIGRASCRERV